MNFLLNVWYLIERPLNRVFRRLSGWRAHRAEWNEHRRAGDGGEYPGIDKPFTWAQKTYINPVNGPYRDGESDNTSNWF